MENIQTEKKYNIWIWILSITIPVVVAILFSVNLHDLGYDVQPLSFLPPIYAAINGLTAVLLVFAVTAIKRGNQKLHELLVKICIGCSIAFLLMYVAYHMTSVETKFGGEGFVRYMYFFILITHILLSIIIIPFVDRKSTRLNSSHVRISYAVFCLNKKIAARWRYRRGY